MKTDSGTQQTLPWFTGQMELQPAQNQPEPICFTCLNPITAEDAGFCPDCEPCPEALGLRVLSTVNIHRRN